MGRTNKKTGKRNKARTDDALSFLHDLTAAGGKKAFRRNAQPAPEWSCSKGAWGIPNKQRREPDGYPGALLAKFTKFIAYDKLVITSMLMRILNIGAELLRQLYVTPTMSKFLSELFAAAFLHFQGFCLLVLIKILFR